MNSRALRYQSLAYRVSAVAVNGLNPATWPYYWERLKRRAKGEGPRHLPREAVLEVYGAAFTDVDTALRRIGLSGSLEDPRDAYPSDFAAAERRIASLHIPFAQLGIAGSGDLTLLHSVARALQPSRMLETGVALGWSSLVMLKAAQAFAGHVVSIDLPYPFLRGGGWVGAAVPPELHGYWNLLRTSDRLGLPTVAKEDAFDLIHYDSDKTDAARRWAYPLLWRALAPGGVLISDDVDDSPAWAEFCSEHGLPLIVVQRKKCAGIVRKNREA